MLDQQKIDTYIMTNQKYFPEGKIIYLKDKLRTMDDEKFSLIMTVPLKDTTTLLLVSIFLGVLGIDRFMLGQVGFCIFLLLFFCFLGILNFIDWFTIANKTKEINFNKIMTLL